MIKQEFLEISLNKDLMVDVHYKNGCVAHNQMYCSGWYHKEFELNEVICIPRCRPLSDLIRPIEHMGETFIPILKLAEIIGYEDAELIKNKCCIDFIEAGSTTLTETLHYSNKDGFYINIEDYYYTSDVSREYKRGILSNQLKLYQKLIEWHFDIFNGQENGELININELKINPYK